MSTMPTCWHPPPPTTTSQLPRCHPQQLPVSCHITHSNVATRQRTMTLVVIHHHFLFNEHNQHHISFMSKDSCPLPHDSFTDTHSRYHIAVSNVATKRQGEQQPPPLYFVSLTQTLGAMSPLATLQPGNEQHLSSFIALFFSWYVLFYLLSYIHYLTF